MKKLQLIISIFIVFVLFAQVTANAYAHPTSQLEFDCSGIHWEMQNSHPRFTQKFAASVRHPINEVHSVLVAPGEWGTLEVPFPEHNGSMRVQAAIYIAGDVERIDQVINCGEMPIEEESTPTAKVKVLSGGDKKQVQVQEVKAEVIEGDFIEELPETGVGAIGLLSLIPLLPVGYVLRKWGKTPRS